MLVGNTPARVGASINRCGLGFSRRLFASAECAITLAESWRYESVATPTAPCADNIMPGRASAPARQRLWSFSEPSVR